MTYYGKVKDSVIVLNSGKSLPEGMPVRVHPASEESTTAEKGPQAPKGSAQAILEALKRSPIVDNGDVDELERLIREGKKQADFRDPFENGE